MVLVGTERAHAAPLARAPSFDAGTPAPRRRALALEVVATQERHLPVDEVEQGGVGLLGMRAHEAPEALDGATRRAARVREEHAREAWQVEASSARLVATMTASSPARARSSSSLRTARLTSR